MGRLVVSLSSIPPPFAGLRTTFDYLLAQTDDIRPCNLKSYRRFPNWTFFADDIWLSGQMERNGVGIRVLPRMKNPRTEANHDVDPLWSLSVEGRDRRALNIACIEGMQSTYGIWRAA